MQFIKIDGDTHRDIMQQHSVNSFPTFKFFVAGAEVESFSGANQDRFVSTVASLCEQVQQEAKFAFVCYLYESNIHITYVYNRCICIFPPSTPLSLCYTCMYMLYVICYMCICYMCIYLNPSRHQSSFISPFVIKSKSSSVMLPMSLLTKSLIK